MQGRNLVSLPLKLDGERLACATTLTVLKRFEFESQLLRSGVLAVDSAGSSDETVVFVRGAPSCIEQLMGKDKVPPNYCQVCANASPCPPQASLEDRSTEASQGQRLWTLLN